MGRRATQRVCLKSDLQRELPWRLTTLHARGWGPVTEHCPRATSSPSALEEHHYAERYTVVCVVEHFSGTLCFYSERKITCRQQKSQKGVIILFFDGCFSFLAAFLTPSCCFKHKSWTLFPFLTCASILITIIPTFCFRWKCFFYACSYCFFPLRFWMTHGCLFHRGLKIPPLWAQRRLSMRSTSTDVKMNALRWAAQCA